MKNIVRDNSESKNNNAFYKLNIRIYFPCRQLILIM